MRVGNLRSVGRSEACRVPSRHTRPSYVPGHTPGCSQIVSCIIGTATCSLCAVVPPGAVGEAAARAAAAAAAPPPAAAGAPPSLPPAAGAAAAGGAASASRARAVTTTMRRRRMQGMRIVGRAAMGRDGRGPPPRRRGGGCTERGGRRGRGQSGRDGSSWPLRRCGGSPTAQWHVAGSPSLARTRFLHESTNGFARNVQMHAFLWGIPHTGFTVAV